ncbi:MEKHLA domain-containing protein [Virgisporangium aliadipatigenens]|uniref:MEKHLA domain-containing protein n=1 Tax=Virgisporangium aliadipatigenens TaxID=741659 RepID=A0A8J3YIS5_9ACTN|nr:MEKHLA domain-containing protein [Virgisporangium aliadipatigenens]GIJ44943.1 MEKHLA domain-containing protein [Virgisporangium aliadipatigenens]
MSPDAPGRDPRYADLIADSYLMHIGEELVPGGLRGTGAASWLYDASAPLLAHDAAADPLFVYANRKAQALFGYEWDEFVGLPSRLSAGEQDRESRRAFLESVRRQGYADNYRGPRVTRDGRRFWIENATVWNLVGPDGAPAGQAAMILRWSTGRATAASAY